MRLDRRFFMRCKNRFLGAAGLGQFLKTLVLSHFARHPEYQQAFKVSAILSCLATRVFAGKPYFVFGEALVQALRN